MGQKVHPNLIRLFVHNEEGNERTSANWFVKDKKLFSDYLARDIKLRHYLQAQYAHAGLAKIKIERAQAGQIQGSKKKKTGEVVSVIIYASRPSALIGKSGSNAETLKKELSALDGAFVRLTIKDVKKPDWDAKLISESIAKRLESREGWRRVMKMAVRNAERSGVKGIKIMLSGRLGGAEIARQEKYQWGSVPLQKFRANIGYNLATAKTTYGIIGVKVWVYLGDVEPKKVKVEEQRGG